MTEHVSPYLVLQARAEARALLFKCCKYEDLEKAVQPLLQYAFDSGIVDQIGAEQAWAIVNKAFAGVAEV